MSKVYENDGYIMLLDALYFAGVKVGNISEDGIDWGGDAPEYIKLHAAQVRTGPVKRIRKKGATNVLKFNMIEMLPKNCAMLMGGTVSGDGWKAASDNVSLEGPVKIVSGTGYTINVGKVSLDGVVRGKLGGDDPLHIETEMEVLQPTDGSAQFEIVTTQPFISANPATLTFIKGGESKTVDISASGPFTFGAVPDGFEVKVTGGYVTITAANNTGSARNGKIKFTLAADSEKYVEVSVSQP